MGSDRRTRQTGSHHGGRHGRHAHHRRPRSNAARICTILGFVFAVVAVFLAPVIFGVIGVILGVVGAVLGDKPLGWYAAAASVVGAVLGLVLAAAILNA